MGLSGPARIVSPFEEIRRCRRWRRSALGASIGRRAAVVPAEETAIRVGLALAFPFRLTLDPPQKANAEDHPQQCDRQDERWRRVEQDDREHKRRADDGYWQQAHDKSLPIRRICSITRRTFVAPIDEERLSGKFELSVGDIEILITEIKENENRGLIFIDHDTSLLIIRRHC